MGARTHKVGETATRRIHIYERAKGRDDHSEVAVDLALSRAPATDSVEAVWAIALRSLVNTANECACANAIAFI